jgi:hypothetical protein
MATKDAHFRNFEAIRRDMTENPVLVRLRCPGDSYAVQLLRWNLSRTGTNCWVTQDTPDRSMGPDS